MKSLMRSYPAVGIFAAVFFTVGWIRADETDAIRAVVAVGGKYERDELAPGKPVTKIDLAGTKAGDALLKQLAALPQLQSLDLQDTLATNAGLKLLQSSPSLRELYLAGTK